ncbi:hypothetical protein Tco_1085315 [Tanacetum coccineum]
MSISKGSGKVSDEISTAGKKKDTASEEVPPVSTAEVHISTAGRNCYLLKEKCREKEKDKALRLEEQWNEETELKLLECRDAKDNGSKEERKKVMEEAKTAKVKERYSSTAPEGYDLMLWGDLHTLFEPDKDDEIWRDQHEYNLLSWRLCDFCGIPILLIGHMDWQLSYSCQKRKYP